MHNNANSVAKKEYLIVAILVAFGIAMARRLWLLKPQVWHYEVIEGNIVIYGIAILIAVAVISYSIENIRNGYRHRKYYISILLVLIGCTIIMDVSRFVAPKDSPIVFEIHEIRLKYGEDYHELKGVFKADGTCQFVKSSNTRNHYVNTYYKTSNDTIWIGAPSRETNFDDVPYMLIQKDSFYKAKIESRQNTDLDFYIKGEQIAHGLDVTRKEFKQTFDNVSTLYLNNLYQNLHSNQ